ncbi:hypothetical protein RSAG8_00832, partial [Rhizoctonia solani AG-8 WAC10335]
MDGANSGMQIVAAFKIIVAPWNHDIATSRSSISITWAAIYFTSHLLKQGKSAKDIYGTARAGLSRRIETCGRNGGSL